MGLVVYIMGILFGCLQGLKEGILYHLKDPDKSVNFNEHLVFTAERLVVFTIMYLLVGPVVTIASLLAFPFMHDGAYYATRNYLNPNIYENGWLDQSTTSTAWTTKVFTPWTRTLLQVISLLIILFYTIYQNS